MEADINKKISGFILNNFLFGNSAKMPGEDESLIENGVIDSTGILELIQFLESTFGVKVDEEETLPQNLDGIANLTRFIAKKTAAG